MPVPLVIPADLRSQVAKIARKAKAKQAEVYRMAIRCGLEAAEQRLVAKPDRLFPNIDPLPETAMARWHKSQESKEWESLERAASRGQAIPAFED